MVRPSEVCTTLRGPLSLACVMRPGGVGALVICSVAMHEKTPGSIASDEAGASANGSRSSQVSWAATTPRPHRQGEWYPSQRLTALRVRTSPGGPIGITTDTFSATRRTAQSHSLSLRTAPGASREAERALRPGVPSASPWEVSSRLSGEHGM